jgi:hypothetical protein
MTFQDKVYVSGGGVSGHSHSLHCYTINTITWTPLMDMHEERGLHGMACDGNNHIYVAGGENGKHCLRSCERYDLSTNKASEMKC